MLIWENNLQRNYIPISQSGYLVNQPCTIPSTSMKWWHLANLGTLFWTQGHDNITTVFSTELFEPGLTQLANFCGTNFLQIGFQK